MEQGFSKANSSNLSTVDLLMLGSFWRQTQTCSADFRNVETSPPEIIGNVKLQPVVDDRQAYEHAPKLQWYYVIMDAETFGCILMSVQLLQIPEKVIQTVMYSEEESLSPVNNKMLEVLTVEDDMPMPLTLVPQLTTYKFKKVLISDIVSAGDNEFSRFRAFGFINKNSIDIYWWGLRNVNTTRKPCAALEIDDLVVKSDVITEKQPNCNFPNGRISQTFKAPSEEFCSSHFNISLYDSNTFGRTSFLGSHVVKNPNKYLINWIALSEREEKVSYVSVVSSSFVQVSPTLCVKKQQTSDSLYRANPLTETNIRSIVKVSKWRRVFGKKDPDEEECALLPMFSKENHREMFKNSFTNCSDDTNWWFRYQNSENCTWEEDNPDLILIYTSELESQPEFSKFKDWCTTLKFYKSKKCGIAERDDMLYCGSLKAGIAIYEWPPPGDTVAVSLSGVELSQGYFFDHPINNEIKFLVRVYIIKGTNLLTKDYTGKSDAYVTVNCGNKLLGNRTKHVPNTVNPIFGKMFEFRCSIPDDYLLTVALYDHETVAPDELIGVTTIDLENRIYSKHKARVGLSGEYNLTGSTKWRDSVKPSKILEDICVENHLPLPIYPDSSTVLVNGVEHRDTNKDSKENICLSILRKWQTLPLCGYNLVPEHVETRSLYNTDKPGIVQGQIHMWVDIYQLGNGISIPRPVDVTPKVEQYELRVVVSNVLGLKFNEGEKSRYGRNIFVKGWIGSVDQSQISDVYYGSNGEGNFNWRMIFNFFHQRAGSTLVSKEIGPFIEYEEHLPPVLEIEVINCDEDVSPDYCIGSLQLNLNTIPIGEESADDCYLNNFTMSKKINLFCKKTVRAWWPLETADEISGNPVYAGAIDLELMLLPKEKALLMPVDVGRSPSRPIPASKRQENKDICQGRSLKLILAVLLLPILVFCTIRFCFVSPK